MVKTKTEWLSVYVSFVYVGSIPKKTTLSFGSVVFSFYICLIKTNTMSKAQVFLDLQAKVNQEIDELGQATNESANQLESLSNELTDQEIDEVCEKARAQSMYEQGLRHY